ncbi:MAG: chorismate mutase [Arcobacteraceae bacterium]
MIEPKQCADMNEIRTAIDEIDNDIVKLISKRSQYVHEASKFKKDELAVKDSSRVTKVINSKRELALKYGASPELIGDIYKMMLDFFIEEELKEWNNQQNK